MTHFMPFPSPGFCLDGRCILRAAYGDLPVSRPRTPSQRPRSSMSCKGFSFGPRNMHVVNGVERIRPAKLLGASPHPTQAHVLMNVDENHFRGIPPCIRPRTSVQKRKPVSPPDRFDGRLVQYLYACNDSRACARRILSPSINDLKRNGPI